MKANLIGMSILNMQSGTNMNVNSISMNITINFKMNAQVPN